MRLRVQLFAGLREALGCRALFLEAPLPKSVAELEAQLQSLYPVLATASFRVAVDDAFALGETTLSAESEVALIPPVSGG